jgi:copper chaperone CopZ
MVTDVSTRPAAEVGWREIRRYAYADRPFEDVWPVLTKAPGKQLIETSAGRYHGTSHLHAHLAGVDVSRTVKVRFAGVVCDEEVARLALRWEDASHPLMFPLLEGVIELVPLTCGRRRLTQVGLVGRYRPPLGRLGAAGDIAAGAGVAGESVGRFLDGLARRLETLVEAVPAVGEEAEPTPDPEEDGSGVALREVFVPVDRLGRRPGGAAGVARRLASISGVARAEVDPGTGLAEVEYDPAYCNLQRLQDELEDDGLPPTDG